MKYKDIYLKNLGYYRSTDVDSLGVHVEIYGDTDNILTPSEVQALADAYDELPPAKTEAKDRVKLHASGLVAALYPFINPDKNEAIGLYNFTVDMYMTTVPAARQPLSGNLLTFKGIHDTAVAKIAEVDLLTDWASCDAYDATIGW